MVWTGTQMRDGNQDEGVGARFKRFNALPIVDELDDGKFQGMATAQDIETIVLGAPSFLLIGQHGEACNGTGVATEEPVVVREHALGEVAVPLTLDLDVDVDSVLFAILEDNLY